MAVLQNYSFTKAARMLGISQPAVSQNISELEKSVGTRLFLRKKGEIVLTNAGLAFKEYAARLLSLYSAVGEAFSPDSGESRTVRIEADFLAASSILPSLEASIRTSFPGVSLIVNPPGSESGCDLKIWTEPHKPELSLEESGSIIGQLEAVALASDQVTHFDALWKAPVGVKLAVWEPYFPMLPIDVAANVCVRSYSPEAILKCTFETSDFVGILPKQACFFVGLNLLPIDLRFLLLDLKMVVPDHFAGHPFAAFIERILRETYADTR